MSKHIPNIITLIRIAMLPAMITLFLLNFQLIAISIFIVAALTDFLDGFIARKWNLVTDLGKLLDPIADKMLFYSGLVLVALSGALPDWAIATVFFVMLLRDFAVDCMRMLAGAKGIVVAANVWGKIKTIVSLIAIPWLMFAALYNESMVQPEGELLLSIGYPLTDFINITGYCLIGLATLLCAISGIIYFIQNRKVFK